MDSQQTQQMPSDKFTVRGAANVGYVVANGWSACLWPFMRRGFGMEALGVTGLVGLGIQLLCICIAGAPEMVGYMFVWLGLVLYHRARSWRAERRGEVQHSRYAGYPWLAMWCPFVKRQS